MENVIFFDYNGVFHTRLRDLIEEHNITKQKLSDEIGVSRQAISQYCDGTTIPNTDKLLKIADYFNVSLDYLVGKTKAKTTVDTEEGETIRTIEDYTGLKEEVIVKLHSIVKVSLETFEEQPQEDFVTEESFLERKHKMLSRLLLVNAFLVSDDFMLAIEHILAYTCKMIERTKSITSEFEKIQQISPFEIADSLLRIPDETTLRLHYFEAVDTFKRIIDDFCNPIYCKWNKAEEKLKYLFDYAVTYENIGDKKYCVHTESNSLFNLTEAEKNELKPIKDVITQIFNSLLDKENSDANDNETE